MSYEIGIGGPPEEVYHISVSASRPSLIDKPPGQGGTGETSNKIFDKTSLPDGTEILKKINSNINHKPYKPKKVDSTLVYENYKGEKRYWKYSKTNHPIHYVYLLEQFQGLEYDLDSYENLDSFMPFNKQNPQLTQASKDFIQAISYYMNRSAYDISNYIKNYGDSDYGESHIGTTYSRWSQVRNDISGNLQEFILSHARSALKAGVPCQTILNDIKENMSITGLDDETFLNACREEKGIELGRMHHENTEESICCIDVEMQPNKYRNEGESFDSYFGRLKNTLYWGNLSLTYEFL